MKQILGIVLEADSGYCIGFDEYVRSTPVAEHSEQVGLDQESTQTTKIVVRLLAKTGLLHAGHHIYMANYYKSPELFDELSVRETCASGTVSKNRKVTRSSESETQNATRRLHLQKERGYVGFEVL